MYKVRIVHIIDQLPIDKIVDTIIKWLSLENKF